MVVEDDNLLRVMMADMLAPLDFEVIEAQTGEEALELVKKYPPDVILLDVLMPGIDGYEVATRLKGSTSEHIIGLLERRLDALVYRAKFVPTVFAARQFVSHGHVRVNGRRVTIPSYRVRVGDTIELRDKARDMALVLEATKSAERDVPDYIDADHSKMTAKMTRIPALSDVPYPVQMEPNLVVEFYSR